MSVWVRDVREVARARWLRVRKHSTVIAVALRLGCHASCCDVAMRKCQCGAKFTYEEARWCAKARIWWCGVPSSFGMEHGDVGAEANNVQEVLGRVVTARWRVSDGGLAFQEWRSDTMTW